MPKPSYTPAEALNTLMKQLSTREMCSWDVEQLLKRWGVEKQEHAGILKKLQQDGFLDERRYVRAFVRDKTRFDHWGLVKISYMLKMKGIPGSLIREATAEIDRSEYRAMVFHELQKKKKSLTGSPLEITAKLFRYGSSRGYELDVMRDFLGDEDPDD
jgi:regulatory protein